MSANPQLLAEPASRLRVATWSMDHWKRTVQDRDRAWAALRNLSIDVALLQETRPQASLPRGRIVYRTIGTSRTWGSAVVGLRPDLEIDEIDAVKTRHSSQLFSMLGTFPGAVIVATRRFQASERSLS